MKKLLCSVVLVLLLFPMSVFAQSDIFAAMKHRLKYLANRQALIANNIANANTPGFKALDLEPVDFNSASKYESSPVRLVTTSSGHIAGHKRLSSFRKKKIKDAYETAPDGNNVVLEQQSVKMSEVGMDYRTTLNMMGKMKGLIQTAIGDRSQ